MKSSKIVFKTLIILTLIGCKKDKMGLIINEDGYPEKFKCQTFSQAHNLIAYYTFNGNGEDESDYHNHGQFDGPKPVKDRKSKEKSALHFDGHDDIFLVNDNAQTYLGCEFTLSAWINTETEKTQTIIRKGSHVNGTYKRPFELGLSAGGYFNFSVTTDIGSFHVGKKGYETNTWYLVTGVLKNESLYLYINGVLEDTIPIYGEIIDDPLPLLIGTRLRLPSDTFKGEIDDVRI
jgi:hypothetical protein